MKYALHAGKKVADAAVQTYEGLKQVKETIDMLQTRINIEGEFVFFEVEGLVKAFIIADFPLNDRVSQRGFVRENGLVGSDILNVHDDTWFSAREMTIIALYKSINEYLSR